MIKPDRPRYEAEDHKEPGRPQYQNRDHKVPACPRSQTGDHKDHDLPSMSPITMQQQSFSNKINTVSILTISITAIVISSSSSFRVCIHPSIHHLQTHNPN
ncbi:hypothetical protein QVD17_21394 [Tagetes erecta]|uniref:Uncharacterized protein n=1 Tax=Tagetes erecta TaxID=13708 RepID=A0AAD8NSY0_TARER|nr:hypothetical protein QVD17_21394 [Tagetes erecta]